MQQMASEGGSTPWPGKRKPPTRAAALLAQAAKEELAGEPDLTHEELEEEEVEMEDDVEETANERANAGAHVEDEDGQEEADAVGVGGDRALDASADPEQAYPVERAAMHGSYIRSLLSAGGLLGGGYGQK